MTAHVVVRQVVAADADATFALIHDYQRRLTWDTLLRHASTVDGRPPGEGVQAVCKAKWRTGGLTFATRYVTFRPPLLAAVTLVDRTAFFATWTASIRHTSLGEGSSEVIYTMPFACRPKPLAPMTEPVVRAAFAWETRRRLRALARYLQVTTATGG